MTITIRLYIFYNVFPYIQALLSITIQKMGENEELWLAYMLQFLNRFYSVNRNSNIFTYFSTLSQSHEDISNRIVWLHCSFDLISKKIISFLGLADATSVDSNDKTLDEESLKLLSHPEKCAKAVILKFHESLKSLSKRTTIEDFNAKIRRLLVQYHEMVNLIHHVVYLVIISSIDVFSFCLVLQKN